MNAYNAPDSHTEHIMCPKCNSLSLAIVEHTTPFWSYVHECPFCGEVIAESEWDEYNEPELRETPTRKKLFDE